MYIGASATMVRYGPSIEEVLQSERFGLKSATTPYCRTPPSAPWNIDNALTLITS